MTNELSTEVGTKVLDKVAKLNKMAEFSQVALGIGLVKIKDEELFKGRGYESFKDYYSQELGRVKSDISKLLTVGRFMIDNDFPEETPVGYTKLYLAQSVFSDKDPNYILSAAQTNTAAEMLENKREGGLPSDHEHQWEEARHCKDEMCGKYERL